MGKRVKHLKVSVYHQECEGSRESEKQPELKFEQMSPVNYLRRKEGMVEYEILWNITAPDNAELEKYLKSIKREHRLSCSILKKADTEALVLWRTKAKSSSYDKVIQSNILYSKPITVQRGYEIHDVIATDPDRMKKMLQELSDIGELKILRIGDYDQERSSVKLTSKQKQALNTALSQGYYSWPRKVNLEELALCSNLSMRAFQERLRRAEAKLLPVLLEKELKKNKR
ncbi:MAG: helix-turn-helix domain-containing protein [Candidatus Micrarchaeota archaeon]